MRVLNTPFISDWHDNKTKEIRELTAAGKVPIEAYAQERLANDDIPSMEEQLEMMFAA